MHKITLERTLIEFDRWINERIFNQIIPLWILFGTPLGRTVRNFFPHFPRNLASCHCWLQRRPFWYQTDWKFISCLVIVSVQSSRSPGKTRRTWTVDFFLPLSGSRTSLDPGWTGLIFSSSDQVLCWGDVPSIRLMSDCWWCGSAQRYGECCLSTRGS